MRDRILKTRHGTFSLAPWNGKNESGIEPLCDKVLVRVDAAMEKTAGGIIVTEQIGEQQTLSSTTGVLVALGPQAFTWNTDRTVRWEGEKPEPGMRICFSRYAGQEYDGLDGAMYRVMEDRSVAGTQGMAEVEAAPAIVRGGSIITGSSKQQPAKRQKAA